MENCLFLVRGGLVALALMFAVCQGAPAGLFEEESISVYVEDFDNAVQMYEAGKGNVYDYLDAILSAEKLNLDENSNFTDQILDGAHSREKRLAILASLVFIAPLASAVFAGGSFAYGIHNGQARLAELRAINRKLDALDRRLDTLQSQLGSLSLGQQWLEGAVLYGKDIQRLNYFLNFLDNNLRLNRRGQLTPANQANRWADAVLNFGADGAAQVLLNLHDMMMGTSGVFGRKSLFLLYSDRLDQDADDYWTKVRQFLEFTFSIQTAGYASWATALNIKGRSDEAKGITAQGLQRLTQQRNYLKPHTLQWPTGTYGLPRTNTGCPVAAGVVWRTGERYHDTEDYKSDNQWSDGIHFERDTFGKNNMRQKFCMKTNSGGDGNWPRGNYCIFKKGSCPSGFASGWLKWDDEDDNNKNSVSGVVPDGDYDHNTKIEYCCRQDGNHNHQIALPNKAPFYLFRHTNQCQKVAGMSVRDEYFRWDNEDDDNSDDRHGPHPYDDGGRRDHKLHYCYYY